MKSLGKSFWTLNHETLLIQGTAYSKSREPLTDFFLTQEQGVFQIPWDSHTNWLQTVLTLVS